MVEIRDKIERRPIGSLIPYARNARTHSDAQIQQIGVGRANVCRGARMTTKPKPGRPAYEPDESRA